MYYNIFNEILRKFSHLSTIQYKDDFTFWQKAAYPSQECCISLKIFVIYVILGWFTIISGIAHREFHDDITIWNSHN